MRPDRETAPPIATSSAAASDQRPPRPGATTAARWCGSASTSAASATPIRAGCCRCICRAGDVTKSEIGAIKIFDRDTRFQIVAEFADKFADAARAMKPNEGRISRVAVYGRRYSGSEQWDRRSPGAQRQGGESRPFARPASRSPRQDALAGSKEWESRRSIPPQG